MVYVGIDIGKRKHEATFLDAAGQQLGKSLTFDNSPQGFQSLSRRVASLAAEEVIYGLEATGHYWLPLYTALVEAGCTVKVINPIQSDSLRNLYIRVTKNDRKDSFLVAEVLRFGRYTETKIAAEPMLQLRELSRLRVEITESVGAVKQRILVALDKVFPEFQDCFANVFGRTALEVLKTYPDPEQLAGCDLEALVTLLRENSRGRLGLEKAQQLKACARNTFGIRYGLHAFIFELDLLIKRLEFLMDQVKEIDARITELMQEHELILTIPGVGPTNGAAILGEIGDINRFNGPKKLRAYAGLDASVYQSGGFEGSHPRMSKRGSPYLRRALWTAAVVASQRDTRFKEFYERLLARGKHPKQALIAVAAKLCGIVYAVLSKNEPYDPNHLTNTHNEKTVDLC